MLVEFIQDVVWYDVTWTTGQTAELDDILFQRFKRAGYIKEVKKRDTDITTHQDGGIVEPADNGASQNPSKGRGHRRDK